MVVCLCLLSFGFVPPTRGYPMFEEYRKQNGDDLQFYGGASDYFQAQQQPYSWDRADAPIYFPPIISQSQYQYYEPHGGYDYYSYRPTIDNEDLHDEELIRRSSRFEPENKWASLKNLGKVIRLSKKYGPLVMKLLAKGGMLALWWVHITDE